ncbi:PTS sugar transporter subunit IIA [Lacticaseibacillus baoqingensis]|uniref:PTS sugar transporter subunit IIA n=1 Tax=Lacticaseibacillus baoqingensis TaxID=2486013 RepID=A0ABW4EB36_9LACO
MRKIIICSHGNLAQGMLNTLEMIVGHTGNIEAYCAYVNEDEAIDEMLQPILKMNQGNELFVLTDIFGGSVNNEWMKALPENPNIHLIAGMNLPFLIDLVTRMEDSKDVDALIESCMANAISSFTYCNKLELDECDDTEF